MCGRYYVEAEDQTEELQKIIDEAQRRSRAQVKTGEIFPTDVAPVIARNRNGERAPFAMRFGYALTKGLIVNARSETADEKPLFRDGMRHRRCLVPASWYFEWEKRGKEKIKYAIAPETVGGGLLRMAGLYRLEPGTRAASFVILTREAAGEIAFIHDRMPVIVNRALEGAWLDTQNDPREVLMACGETMAFRAAV